MGELPKLPTQEHISSLTSSYYQLLTQQQYCSHWIIGKDQQVNHICEGKIPHQSKLIIDTARINLLSNI